MLVTLKIHENVQKLPAPFQAEVLDFVEYLLIKSEREIAQQGESDWSSFSLASAMRGMEDEDTTTFTMDDLKVVFS
ncbi:MAG: DUF2281 domain-containing protein [Chloroflexi bacterium]|nr:DUF2281 domain-containing protein [Chloroflexota bacterium]MBU1660643.1 DUF2281 domain-containing protein [Chloroflexota bacterium]